MLGLWMWVDQWVLISRVRLLCENATSWRRLLFASSELQARSYRLNDIHPLQPPFVLPAALDATLRDSMTAAPTRPVCVPEDAVYPPPRSPHRRHRR